MKPTVAPIYIFLDCASGDENNLNTIDFTDASYMIVNSSDFQVLARKEFKLDGAKEGKASDDGQNDKDTSKTSNFQNFIQHLTDSIHNFCILKEKPFAFIVTRGWDLRLKFIKYSKDIGEQLPNYLEYPSFFDLKKEFIKYQESNNFAEFNSLNYNRISLDSMMTALKLKDVENNSLDKMCFITKKIVEDKNSEQTFRKPHDMNLDLSHFFIEKSRIIYLTNLPSDTTQSELEVWFSQFNSRSITFWLLKNPIMINPTIANTDNSNLESSRTCSGFAIFATHEDAIEALVMNGRLLNDKLVELQPSSVCVLDKAQDILSPFPSSKNKPRPGDWNCPSCGFSNFQRRTACFRCSFPVASAAAVQESMYGGNQSANASTGTLNLINSKQNNNNGNNINNGRNGNGNANNSMNYYNGNNQYVNYNYNSNNSSGANISTNSTGGNTNTGSVGTGNYNNNNMKNDSGNSFNAGVNGNNNNHNGNNSNNNNNGNNSNGYNSRQSSNVPFRAGDWKCLNEACSYHNFAKNICCLKCGAPRVQSAIINGHPHNQHHHHHNSHNGKNNNGNNNNNNNNNNRGTHLMDANYSDRSNSLPNHMNLQFGQNGNNYSNHFQTQQLLSNQSNFNKFKNNSNDLYGTTSVSGTPHVNRQNVYNSNANTNTSLPSGQLLNSDFDIASHMGGLSLNNTGASGNSSLAGNASMNNMMGMQNFTNNLNGLNGVNMNMNNLGMNGFGTVNNMSLPLNMNNMSMNGLSNLNEISNIGNMNNLNKQINGISGLNVNGLNGLNGLNNFNGLTGLGRTLSSPVIPSAAVGGGSSASTGFGSSGNDNERSVNTRSDESGMGFVK